MGTSGTNASANNSPSLNNAPYKKGFKILPELRGAVIISTLTPDSSWVQSEFPMYANTFPLFTSVTKMAKLCTSFWLSKRW